MSPTALDILKKEATEACLTPTQQQLVLAAMREIVDVTADQLYTAGVLDGATAERERNYNNINVLRELNKLKKELFPEK